MAWIVRYDIITKTSITPIILSFYSKRAADHHEQYNLPKYVHNLAKYEVDVEEEPRQQPTYYHDRKASTKWWDANKRPGEDRYELNGENL